MDDKSLEMLEFPRIREILAGYTSFSTSRELAIALKPYHDYERISLMLNQTAEARSLLGLEPGFSIGNVLDVREMLKMAALRSVLEPQSLLEIQQTLSYLHQLRSSLGMRRISPAALTRRVKSWTRHHPPWPISGGNYERPAGRYWSAWKPLSGRPAATGYFRKISSPSARAATSSLLKSSAAMILKESFMIFPIPGLRYSWNRRSPWGWATPSGNL